MTPVELEQTYAEGVAALKVLLGIQKTRNDDVAEVFAGVQQSKDAWLASRLEEPCPDCGAQAYEGCRPDCLGEQP